MKTLIIVLLMCFSSPVFPNCELYSTGFHTVAVYLHDHPETFTKNFYPLNFREKGKDVLLDLSPGFNLKKIKKVINGNKTCNVQSSSFEYSIGSEQVYQKIPMCEVRPSELKLYKENVFYNSEDESISLPRLSKLILYENIQKKMKYDIEKNITDFLKDKNFQGTSKLLIETSNYKIESVNHFIYEGSKLVLSVANAKTFNEKLKNFQLIFLSLNNELWYIADSSIKTSCESSADFGEYETGYQVEQHQIKPLETFQYGWIYGNKDYPQILSFPDSRYYLEFKKKLVVLDKLFYLHLNNQDTSFGLQPKEKK